MKIKNIFLMIFPLLILYILFVSLRGILFYDEGYILYGAKRILEGQIPYKDFHFAYTPASLYLTALSFKIFGISVLSGRILMIIVNGVGVFVAYILLKQFVKNKYYIFLGVTAYLFWGIGHINFPWPIMLAIPSGLFHSLLLYKFLKTKLARFAFIAAVFVAMTFLIKQNLGIVLGLQTFMLLVIFKELRSKFFVFFYFLGILLPSLIYAGYLFHTNSFYNFIDDFYTYTIMRIIVEKTLDTPFLYEDSLYGIFMKLFFYLIPVYLGIIAGIKAIKNNRLFLIVIFLVVLYYIVGIRPTTDYPHLVPLLALSGILFPFILLYSKKNFEKLIFTSFAVIFIFLGFWTSIFKNYYRYEQPLFSARSFVNISPMRIWVWEDKHEIIKSLRSELTEKTTKEDDIFVYHYSPLIYFATDRNNISKYDIHPSNEKLEQYNREVIENLESRNGRFVVTLGELNASDQRPLSLYIKNHFISKKRAGDYLIWERKKII